MPPPPPAQTIGGDGTRIGTEAAARDAARTRPLVFATAVASPDRSGWRFWKRCQTSSRRFPPALGAGLIAHPASLPLLAADKRGLRLWASWCCFGTEHSSRARIISIAGDILGKSAIWPSIAPALRSETFRNGSAENHCGLVYQEYMDQLGDARWNSFTAE